MNDVLNPCVTCGACCSFFRVSFYWREADPLTPDGVPSDLVEDINETLSCMKGTNSSNPRCIALEGKIGERLSCSIYSKRPSTCRDFQYLSDDCARARAGLGLDPLPLAFPTIDS